MDSIYKSLHPERFTIYGSFTHSHTEKAQPAVHGASQPAPAIFRVSFLPKAPFFFQFFFISVLHSVSCSTNMMNTHTFAYFDSFSHSHLPAAQNANHR